jgi:hypothetical protein
MKPIVFVKLINMRKTEETPEHYELLEKNSGCAIWSIILIIAVSIVLIVFSFV